MKFPSATHIGVVLTIGVVAIFFAFDPVHAPIFPRCPLWVLTGWKCPGCGLQRALHSLLHLDVANAFAQNALLVCSLPYMALLLVAWWQKSRWPRLYAGVRSRPVVVAVAVLVAAWFVARNVCGW